MRLPRTLDDLTGLRAARWVRESTRGQYDRFGPDAQRRLQDETIAQHGLVDTGIGWTVAHSGRTIDRSPEWREMLAAAGVGYDVLLLGYVNRLSRSVEAFIDAKRHLHSRGAVLLFCSEQVLTSDEDRWERWAREMVEAEAYSRRLGGYIRDGYRAKFEVERDQAGTPPLGFRRGGGRHLLELDPATIGRAVEAFTRYSTGLVGIRPLADELGMAHDGLRELLRNPIYNGWVRRHRRSTGEQLLPAAWRSDPPVSDQLWRRVREVAAGRAQGGSPARRHAHLLGGLLRCDLCGVRIRAERTSDGRHRYRHPRDRCPAWATSTVTAVRFDAVISAQVMAARLPARHVMALEQLAAVGNGEPSDELARRRVERELEERARQHARGRLATDAYLAEHQRLTAELGALGSSQPAPATVQRCVRWLNDLQSAWRLADVEVRHRLATALYDRIAVDGTGVRHVALTPDAEMHAMALALPQRVAVEMSGARPAGNWRPRDIVHLTVLGRREWLQRLRRAA